MAGTTHWQLYQLKKSRHRLNQRLPDNTCGTHQPKFCLSIGVARRSGSKSLHAVEQSAAPDNLAKAILDFVENVDARLAPDRSPLSRARNPDRASKSRQQQRNA